MFVLLRLWYLLALWRPLVRFTALDRVGSTFALMLDLRQVCCVVPYWLTQNGKRLRCLDVELSSGKTYRVIADRRNSRLLGVWGVRDV